MLAKEYRLPGRTRFSRARVSKTPFFLLRTQKNHLAVSRFGFVVAKKVDKRAVIRNRVKRIFRSHIESAFTTLQPGNDFLFILSPHIKDAPAEEVKKILFKTLQEHHLILGEN